MLSHDVLDITRVGNRRGEGGRGAHWGRRNHTQGWGLPCEMQAWSLIGSSDVELCMENAPNLCVRHAVKLLAGSLQVCLALICLTYHTVTLS